MLFSNRFKIIVVEHFGRYWSNKFRWQCARVWIFSIQTYEIFFCMHEVWRKNVKKYGSLFALFLSNGRKTALKLFMYITVKKPYFYLSQRYIKIFFVFIAILFTLNLSTSRGAYFLYFFTTIKSAFQFLYIFIQIYILYGFMYVKSE